jgi:hypothetical protein
MAAAGLDKTHYAFQAGKGVVEVPAGAARLLGFRVGTEPIDKNPHHAGIWPPNAAAWSGSLDRKKRGELSRRQTFVSREPGFSET